MRFLNTVSMRESKHRRTSRPRKGRKSSLRGHRAVPSQSPGPGMTEQGTVAHRERVGVLVIDWLFEQGEPPGWEVALAVSRWV